jgi:perosamine synthetase
MNDISASIGLVQLKKLPQMNARRREIVSRYFEGLANIPQIELPVEDDSACRSAWHIFHIKCQRRDDLSVFLNGKGICTGVHSPPIHTYRCYGNRTTLPVAEELQHRILTLPLYPLLTDDEVKYVIQTIREFYGKA